MSSGTAAAQKSSVLPVDPFTKPRNSRTGDLGYGDTTTVSGRLSGTLTGLASTGSTVRRGQSLYRIDDSPVVLLYGSLPAYRALSPGTEGADVEQFERNLRALGYTGFDVDDEYTSATASAVKEWQDDLGLPETGTVDLGRVVYAKGAVRVDSQEAALGDAVGPGTAVLAYTGTSRAVTVDLDMNDQRLARRGRAVTVTLPTDKRVKGTISKVETVVDSSATATVGAAAEATGRTTRRRRSGSPSPSVLTRRCPGSALRRSTLASPPRSARTC